MPPTEPPTPPPPDPGGLAGWLARRGVPGPVAHAAAPALRHLARIGTLALALSLLLFLIDPLARRPEGAAVPRPWTQADAGAAEGNRLLPPWLTWERYRTFWAHRLAGDSDYSIEARPSRYMRTFGSLIPETARRQGNSALLLGWALGLALAAGTLPALWRRLRGGGPPGGGAWLDALGYLPAVTLVAVVAAVMVRGLGTRPDWHRLASGRWWELADPLLYAAAVLALPMVPHVVRFWNAASAADGRGWTRAGAHAGRVARGLGDLLLIGLGWIAVVEVAFYYPGLMRWAVMGPPDLRIAQAALLWIGGGALLAVALGGRTRLFPARPPGVTVAGGTAAGWFRRLAGQDGVVVGAYLLAAAGAVLAFGAVPVSADATAAGALEPLGSSSALHPLGTDGVGRDVWGLMLSGGRLYLPLALGAALLALALAIVLGAAARRTRVAGVAGRWLESGLDLLPGVWWAYAVVLLAGPGSVWMALGVVLAALPALLARCLPDGPRPPGVVADRALRWGGLLLLATAQSVLLLTHVGFLGFAERRPDLGWGIALREIFAHPHADGVLMVAPALLVAGLTLTLYLPGRLILDQSGPAGQRSPAG